MQLILQPRHHFKLPHQTLHAVVDPVLTQLADLDILMLFLDIDDIAVAPLGLAAVQHLIHNGKETVIILRIRRIGRAAQGSRDKRTAGSQLDILAEHHTFLIKRQKILLLFIVLQIPQIDDQQFVTAKPSDDAETIHKIDQPGSNRHQHTVPRLMSVGIIDKLEIVQIQHCICEWCIGFDQIFGKAQNIRA